MNKIKVTFRLLANLHLTKKPFLMYDIDTKSNRITAYKLTSDLQRYRKKFNRFILVEAALQDIKITL